MLPKDNRLNKNQDFKRIASQAKSTHSQFFLLKKLAAPEKKIKFGVVVSAKVSKKAVIRNKIKRRVREIIRLYLPQFKAGCQVMIIAKSSIITKDFKEIKNDLVDLLIKSRLL